MQKRTVNAGSFRKILAGCLALLLILSLMPITGYGASAREITLYFSNTDGWDQVFGYAWDGQSTPQVGAWPGKQLSRNSRGLYELTLPYTAGSGLSFIFNNNAGSQTGDLTLTEQQLLSGASFWVGGVNGSPAEYAPPQVSNGQVTFVYTGTASKVYVAGSFNGWSTTAAQMTRSGDALTYTCKLIPGSYEYKFVADGNWINDPGNPQILENSNNVLMVTGLRDTAVTAVKGRDTQLPGELSCMGEDGKEQLRPVTYTLQGSPKGISLKDGVLTVTAGCTLSSCQLTASTAQGNTCTVTVNLVESTQPGTKVTLHFLDSQAWHGVAATLWTRSDSGDAALPGFSWPGQTLQRDENGYYTLELEHYALPGQSLGYLFHNHLGVQTQDLVISESVLAAGDVELWIQPKGEAVDNKYACDVATSPEKLPQSVRINGNKVTFRYESSTASKVYVAGSFNGWSTSKAPMNKAGSVFTYTTTLSEGIHEYKFVVDGEWKLDPQNKHTGGYDGNSIFFLGDYTGEDTGKITVKLHFRRSDGDYTGWDTWMWCNGQEGAAYPLEQVGNERVATITIDGRQNDCLNYIVRKSDWSSQEFYDRSIDLSNVSSGTVHFYLISGWETGHLIYDRDVVFAGKPTYANYDYDSGRIWVKTSLPLSGTLSNAFSLVNEAGQPATVQVKGVSLDNGGYSLTLSDKLTLGQVKSLRVKCGTTCQIQTENLFDSQGFINDYTYYGDDLGANWSAKETTFKVWAPTAVGVSVVLYKGGNYGGNDCISTTEMTLGDRGVWELTIPGNWNGKYYNYLVKFPTYTCEATDPYAVSTGANGDRGMILDMDSTDPAGWNQDVSPNQGMNYTDAIIYEMHLREMTIDASSGVKSDWRGTYLGMTQTGTSYMGRATALNHLQELGVTHVQLMPVYDHASVDEYHLKEWEQYAWGYDPKNFNVPEGSYSTDPFNGEVRVKEFKQMVQAFHSSGINVVMDVVYNHAYSGGDFCYNKIVPNYFSRFWGDGSWSNGSGCGNDIATEKSMVRNYIVDSIMHWVEEYHIDGFRVDLAGLIDTQTINEIVDTVHAKYPYVMFYGEGWTGGQDTAVQDGYSLAAKENAWMTPGFSYFNDTLRNVIAGDNGHSTGFASGAWDKADALSNYFRASNGWSTSPSQTINYVSCHDNYSLMDKLCISRNGAYWDQLVKMNNLSAAIYMLAQGTPFIYSGEELLREKINEDGYRVDNGYGTNDYVNKIRWSDLVDKQYAQVTDDYYAGLVAFRKNHAALRCPGGSDAWNYVKYHKINDQCVLFYVDGYPNYECSDGIVIIYNAQENTQWVNLYDYGIPAGNWQACIHGDRAGTSALWSTTNGSVGVDGISATVLVRGDLVHEESVYNQQKVSCRHASHDQKGICADCGQTVEHSYYNGVCGVCNKRDPNYETAKKEYYLFGWINGKDYACNDDFLNMGEYKFVDGMLTATFETDSYIAIKEKDNLVWYMSQSYIQDTTGTFYDTDTGTEEKMFVPGGVELIFYLKENEDYSLTLSYEIASSRQNISGKVTSSALVQEETVLELWIDGDVVPAFTTTTTDGTYSFQRVPVGEYILIVSKKNHVTREYFLTLEEAPLVQDVKICLMGDVNGDGQINIGDAARLYAYSRGKNPLTDEYVLQCANVNGGGLNIGDVAAIYSHVKGSKKLF